MKKSLIALFVAAFCFSSMAQVLVYDFSASFKRLDVKQVTYSYKNAQGATVKNAKMDSAKVVSDKFSGYMVVEACQKCEGDMVESTGDNDAVFYITRSGDKAKNVYRGIGWFYANMFGAKPMLRDGVVVNGDKFTDTSADFALPLVWQSIEETNVGFLGFDNISGEAELYGQGYGKVTKLTTVEKQDPIIEGGDCDGTITIPQEDIVTTCWMVKSLSGSVVGDTGYTGVCNDFLFDVCDLETPTMDHWAPLPGTFTLKLNNSLTFEKKAFRFEDFADAEEEILKKLRLGDKKLYGDGENDLGLEDSVIWGEE
ncbi:MAG: hypothetical protein ACI4SG_04330 [Oligosphaeraceae bacterium]